MEFLGFSEGWSYGGGVISIGGVGVEDYSYFQNQDVEVERVQGINITIFFSLFFNFLWVKFN